MADELIDIFDGDNNPLNLQKMKSEAHESGLWHRAAHVWIYNSKGEILLQLRAKDKKLYPGKWDISASGHVSANEEPIVSALREIEEEIGLSVKEDDLELVQIRKKERNLGNVVNEFYYVYLLRFDGDPNSLKIPKEEVEAIQFLPIPKIEEELKNNCEKYFPHGDYWFDVMNEIGRRLNKSKKKISPEFKVSWRARN